MQSSTAVGLPAWMHFACVTGKHVTAGPSRQPQGSWMRKLAMFALETELHPSHCEKWRPDVTSSTDKCAVADD